MKITNTTGISIPLAVWLVSDDYDYINEPMYISATTLLKPTKQIILAARVKSEDREADVSEFISSRLGTAIHDAIEKAWTNKDKALKRLGYPEKIIERVVVNPTEQQLKDNPNLVPIYLEQRYFKQLAGWKIGGKIDINIEGQLHDTKSTSVYSWILGNKDEYYRDQGSIYRWLRPDIITSDTVKIEFLFTDWSKAEARRNPEKYPQSRLLQHTVPLRPIDETERWLRGKLSELQRYWQSPEEEIPECTDKDLWRGETVYKYYGDATKTDGRSTKNFSSQSEAQQFWHVEKHGKGVVKTVPGEVKACGYCAAYEACKQRMRYDV